MTRVLSVSSSRADVGILAPVWRGLAALADVELHVFLTGMHRMDAGAARAAVPVGTAVHAGGEDLGGAEPEAAAAAIGAIFADTAALLAEIRPDIVLVIGDRLDMLPAAAATLPFNLPLAHLHGGEVTEGAVDDRIRHAISKLAHIHYVTSEGARTLLLAMGEEPWRVHVTGAPGLDTLNTVPALTPEAFARAVGLDGVEGGLGALRLVTVHPETNAADPLAPLEAVLEALATRHAPTLFTAPNSDPGGAEMRRRIERFVADCPWARFRDTLGMDLYANALRHAGMMVGNSSSGIIEAGLFGLPVIDVGDRQKGREHGVNVMHVSNTAAAVIAALDRIGAVPDRFPAGTPYGDGAAGPRVAAALVAALAEGERLTLKRILRDGANG